MRNTTFTPVTMADGSIVMQPNTTETLNPQNQSIYNSQLSNALGLNNLAGQQISNLSNVYNTPFSFNDKSHSKWATDTYNQLNASDNAAQQEAVRTRLSNMGITMGSDAYNREISRLEGQQQRSRDQFGLDSYNSDFQQQMAMYNNPANVVSSLMNGGQVDSPQFGRSGAGTVAGTDVAGIYMQDYNNRLNKYNSTIGNIGGLFSGIGSVFALSEPSEKKNKVKLPDKTKAGLQLWQFNYKGEPPGTPKHTGVMADETQRKMPHAVIKGHDGKRRVHMGLALGG